MVSHDKFIQVQTSQILPAKIPSFVQTNPDIPNLLQKVSPLNIAIQIYKRDTSSSFHQRNPKASSSMVALKRVGMPTRYQKGSLFCFIGETWETELIFFPGNVVGNNMILTLPPPQKKHIEIPLGLKFRKVQQPWCIH